MRSQSSRRGSLKDEEVSRIVSYAERILSEIKVLSINVKEMQEIHEIMRQHRFIVYDASHLYVTERLGGVLITEERVAQRI
jgi:predicted nucleic acid-binding protein